jgi:multiple sugar transport system permease protein
VDTYSVVEAERGDGVAGPGPATPRQKRRLSARGVTLLVFAVPSLVVLLLINLYPVIYAGLQSVRNGDLVSPGVFVGLANYTKVLTSHQFWASASFTVIFTITGVFGSWAVGLAVALLLRTKIPARGVVVVSATSWNYLVATPQSPLPVLASALGFPNILFLANPALARVTVCVFKVWISFPFMMMIMSSALSAVDADVYEAARVDGASAWQTFTRITMPLIARSTYISWILMTIFCVNDFPTIFLLTGGGPTNSTMSLIVLAYVTVFENLQVGPGVAIAFLMTLTLVVISVILYRQLRKAHIA